jgi:hypothetical protein
MSARLGAQVIGTSITTNVKAGLWSDPTTWSRGVVPNIDDDVILSYDVVNDKNMSCKSLRTNGHNIIVKSGIALNLVGSSQKKPYLNEIVYYDSTETVDEKVVTTYKLASIGYDFTFYGTWANGKINKISSVTVNRHNNYDTLMHFIFNSNLDVKHYYVSYRGKKDTSLYRISYHPRDTGWAISRLYTKWNDEALLRQTTFVYSDTNRSSVVYNHYARLMNGCEDIGPLPNIAFKNAFGSIVALSAIPIGLVVGGAIGAIIAIAGATVTYFYQENTLILINKAANLIDRLIPSSCASESTYNNDFMHNPAGSTGQILNPLFVSSCFFSFSWKVSPDTYYQDWRSTGTGSIEILKGFHASNPSLCPGSPPRSDAGSGFLFRIREGESVTITHYNGHYTTCPNEIHLNAIDEVSKSFTCPAK